jgi:hypothetical protein
MQTGTVAKKIGLSVDAIRCRAPRYAADSNKSSSMCIASSPTFRNWNGNFGRRSEAATENCTNDPRTVRFWAIKANSNRRAENED